MVVHATTATHGISTPPPFPPPNPNFHADLCTREAQNKTHPQKIHGLWSYTTKAIHDIT